jgi:dGTPase
MFERVYLAADAQRERPRIERLLRRLFDHYSVELPPAVVPDAEEHERVVDYLAGMTDRFAIRTLADLELPEGYY